MKSVKSSTYIRLMQKCLNLLKPAIFFCEQQYISIGMTTEQLKDRS